ncbi:unnamed protein product [Eruca vesicaria subsp. sativa]|uniref:Uncharacterized protein n=1 Tax=Eruca vesicaria subsp. sativa TaxID=29727 RepID=A0ABC8M446_ERUVS|nr:unnamed protein product [Eruca vesicaria subsp. sativa]
MSDPTGQSSTTTVGGDNGGGGGNTGGSGSSFASQPQRAKVRKQVWAGVLGISSASTNR